MDWSDEQLAIRTAVRNFVEAEIVPIRDELEHGDLEPYDVLRRYMRAFGLDALAVERFRSSPGSGDEDRADRVNMALLPLIELCRHCPGLTTAMGVSLNLAGGTINRQGTQEQRERWALPLLTLEKVGAWAITEPDSGSDAFGGMRATATQRGDEFVLNGAKTFITNGPCADTIVFICKLAGGDEDARSRRIVSFVLDRGMPGLVQGPRMRKMGLHSSPTGEIWAQDVTVGLDRLIGGPAALEPTRADGRGRARQTFASERASVAAMALGIIERCAELSIEYARHRVQFGKPIGDRQLIQEKLAEMEVARLNVENLVLRYIDRTARGAPVTLAEASAMKLYAARAAMQVALEAVQIHGGTGYMAETHVEQLARDAKAMQIYGGTDELQIVAIAKDLLQRT